MGLFQQSVLNKYLNEASQTEMKAAYQKLTAYFHNPVIQQNIRDSKEEQWQGGFLTELFVKVFGYTMNPNPDYNLTTEYRNERGAKKADGALLKDGAAIGVIELKSTTTKDLEAIRLQAFDYKANQSKCVYVITSNFEKVRFYIHNAVEFEEFDLFRLTWEHFQLMWLCLAKENLLRGIPLQVKEASILKEENVTKKIYVDYSRFKYDLYNDLVANNLNHEIFNGKEEKDIRLLLFKKSQKLLDRFLFILFGEDRGLLPANSISKIIEKWNDDTEWGDSKSLYDIFKQYFGFLNTGRPAKGKRAEIHAYNGGLFLPDAILDSVVVSSEMLNKHTKTLTGYDFETEVDVNILGHIFEQSVAAEHAQLRKKDGVFYTPKYITKYNVENTVGKLCEEKRNELELDENDYLKSRKGRTKKKLQELDEKLTTYRDWLLSLTICDPACGSGAFLNQALDFLIREHRYIDELRAKMLDVPMVFTEVENSILENNIYGVDINEESVEIAKLSLWLRTAQKGRKLTTLSNNIKCGNSLIDDPEVAGEKAFNWQTEFPEVFRKKKKEIWHITAATHNSRYSQRMFDNHVTKGEPVWLSEKEELIVMETIASIVKSDELNILEVNICGDHMHMLLVCTQEELPGILQKMKSMSARECNIAMGRTAPQQTLEHAPASVHTAGEHAQEHALEHAPVYSPVHSPVHSPLRGKTQFHLWAQKSGKKHVNSNEQLENTMQYIRNNRKKHQLPEIKALQQIIAGMTCSLEHAFKTEYTGGFDVVIGNPPYVQLQKLGEMGNKLSKCNYQTYNKSADLYCLFYEKGCQILKSKGYLSYITSNKWLRVNYGESLRKFLTTNINPKILLDFSGITVFPDAVVDPHILILTNEPYKKKTEACVIKTSTTDLKAVLEKNKVVREFSSESWTIMSSGEAKKLNRMKQNGTELKNLPVNINYGIKTGFNEAFFIDEIMRKKLIAEDAKSEELIRPMVRGRNIIPFGISDSEYLINVHNGLKEKNPPLPPVEIDEYPAIKRYLEAFYRQLEKRGDKGETPYNLRNCAYLEEFSKPKILYPNMTSVFPFMYDESGLLSNDKSFILTSKDDSISLLFLTAVFNSSLAKLWIWWNCPELGDNRREIRKVYFEHFPVPKANKEQTKILSKLAQERTNLTCSLKDVISKFIRSMQRKFELENMSNKLQKWHLLSYPEFINELGKKKVKLSLSEEAEWEDYFNEQKQKALALKSEIDKTDREIDSMVYELYGLTEEIKIV